MIEYRHRLLAGKIHGRSESGLYPRLHLVEISLARQPAILEKLAQPVDRIVQTTLPSLLWADSGSRRAASGPFDDK